MKEGLVRKLGNTELYVVQGDITQMPANAVMTAINSAGAWFGGIDGAIQRAAGPQYHQQAADKMPLKDLQTVIAKGDRKKHRGQFDDVIFVVDDLESSLDKVVYAGLEAANKEGYESVLIPAIRMGVMAGAVEKTPQQTVENLGKGIKRFMDKYSPKSKLGQLTFVVYNDHKTLAQLSSGFCKSPYLN